MNEADEQRMMERAEGLGLMAVLLDKPAEMPPREEVQKARDAFERAGIVEHPRSWSAMVAAWSQRWKELQRIVPPLTRPIEQPDILDLARMGFRWAWELPPCSEARKAAFSLGRAALAIEAWRVAPEHSLQAREAGQRAAGELRVLLWHIDDARAERSGLAYHKLNAPPIPRHERVYQGEGGDLQQIAGETVCYFDPVVMVRAILGDHLGHRPKDTGRLERASVTRLSRCGIALAHEQAFIQQVTLYLPPGPWTITSMDLTRIIDLILGEP